MSFAARPKPKTTAKTPTKIASTSRAAAAPAPTGHALPAATVTQLELVELLHKGSLIEIVVAEVEPARYQIHLVVIWHFGRSILAGSSGQPRTFRSLDTLRLHLKTLGIGSTLVRLELMA